ncbi:MAG: phosphoribosylglycinamide formyltransferase 2, partial [Mycobacterium sp.]
VYFVDVTSRPHDSGLVTLRSQRLSEFELHARAILGLPVDTIMITPGAAHVVYAKGAGPANAGLAHDDAQTERAAQALSDALAVPESDVRIFPHPKSYPRYRLAVALATAPDVALARQRAHEAVTAVRKYW